MSNLDIQYYIDNKNSFDLKTLAQYEEHFWTEFKTKNPNYHDSKREWLKENFGGTRYDYENRATLYMAGDVANPYWNCISTGMAVGTAVRLYRLAKKSSVVKNIPLAEAIAETITDYNNLAYTSTNKAGRVIKRSHPKFSSKKILSSTTKLPGPGTPAKEFKSKILDIIEAYANDSDLDSFKIKEAKSELIEWIHDGIETFNRKVNRLKSDNKGDQLLKIGETRFIQAIEILALKRSEFVFGKPIPLKLAKKARLTRLRVLHPDVNAGSREFEQEFNAVNEAYKLLENYSEKFGELKNV